MDDRPTTVPRRAGPKPPEGINRRLSPTQTASDFEPIAPHPPALSGSTSPAPAPRRLAQASPANSHLPSSRPPRRWQRDEPHAIAVGSGRAGTASPPVAYCAGGAALDPLASSSAASLQSDATQARTRPHASLRIAHDRALRRRPHPHPCHSSLSISGTPLLQQRVGRMATACAARLAWHPTDPHHQLDLILHRAGSMAAIAPSHPSARRIPPPRTAPTSLLHRSRREPPSARGTPPPARPPQRHISNGPHRTARRQRAPRRERPSSRDGPSLSPRSTSSPRRSTTSTPQGQPRRRTRPISPTHSPPRSRRAEPENGHSASRAPTDEQRARALHLDLDAAAALKQLDTTYPRRQRQDRRPPTRR